MNYHIILGRAVDLAEICVAAGQGDRPRHAMAQLAALLDARIHAPANERASLLDRLRSKLFGGSPQQWAFARAIWRTLGPDDILFCAGEDVGVPIAVRCGGRPGGPKVSVTAHNLDRPRGRMAIRLLRLARRIDLVVAVSRAQLTPFERAGMADERRLFLYDQTDRRFFTPGPVSPGKARPLVVSIGLEQRDYHSLAAAAGDLDVDVRISGFSADAAVTRKALPDALPANMSRRFYEWRDLRQLYRDADLLVVSLFPNRYAAGVQSLVEGMACGAPILATATDGLADYLDRREVTTSVPPGDPVAMREAMIRLLGDRDETMARGRRGIALAADRHDSDVHVATIAAALRRLA